MNQKLYNITSAIAIALLSLVTFISMLRSKDKDAMKEYFYACYELEKSRACKLEIEISKLEKELNLEYFQKKFTLLQNEIACLEEKMIHQFGFSRAYDSVLYEEIANHLSHMEKNLYFIQNKNINNHKDEINNSFRSAEIRDLSNKKMFTPQDHKQLLENTKHKKEVHYKSINHCDVLTAEK